MKKDTKTIWIIAAVILLLAVLILSGVPGQNQTDAQSNPANGTTQVPANASVNPINGSPGAQTMQTITIKDFAFSPSTITINVGDTVKWVNQDSAPHKIKSAGFNSGTLSTGQGFEFTFDTPGSYDYSCGLHPSMRGKVVVQ